MNKYKLREAIVRRETLIEELMMNWGICETTILHNTIAKVRKELEELYVEEKRRFERQRRVKRTTNNSGETGNP
jgi:hypothetical protein